MTEEAVAVDEGSLSTLITAASSLALIAAYYFFNVAQKPKVYAGNKVLRDFVNNHVPCVKEKYWPSWYSWEGRIQSALGLSLRISSSQRLPYRRQIIHLQDGGQLALDFLGETKTTAQIHSQPDNEPFVVLLLPGLTSSSNTSYVKTLAMSIVDAGAIVAVFNNRGLGGVPLRTPRTYCATNNDDLREVIEHLKQTYPRSKFMAIGTSLGGMLLCRYLINCPEEAKNTFVAAVVISICWDPMVGTASLEKPFLNKYIVNYTLTSNLQNLAKRHISVLQSRNIWDFKKVFSVKTIREFDDHFTAPQFGYKSWEEYYRAAQITPDVHKFPIPVFGLNATDDPMQPGADLPTSEAEAGDSNLALIVTERGGHLGFLEGVFPVRRPFHFMERVVQEFVIALATNSHKLQDLTCK